MLRGFSGGKQEIKSANTKMRSSFVWPTQKKRSFNIKWNENRKRWVEVILNAVHHSRSLHSKELWRKTCRTLHFAFCMTRIVVLFWGNKQTRPRLLDYSFGNFITCLPSNCSYPIIPYVRSKVECNMNKLIIVCTPAFS